MEFNIYLEEIKNLIEEFKKKHREILELLTSIEEEQKRIKRYLLEIKEKIRISKERDEKISEGLRNHFTNFETYEQAIYRNKEALMTIVKELDNLEKESAEIDKKIE